LQVHHLHSPNRCCSEDPLALARIISHCVSRLFGGIGVCGDGAARGVAEDPSASAGSGGGFGDLGEDDFHEWGAGDAGTRAGAPLAGRAALELAPDLAPGAQSSAHELRGRAESAAVGVELHSQRGPSGEHARASGAGGGARLHGTF
jgi:hypothetical protein